MSTRRGYTVRCVCSFPGCKETSFYHYDTQRDMREGTAARQQRAGTWLCVRHTSPDEVLSESNSITSQTLLSVELDCGKFWSKQGDGSLRSGFVFGNGYKAYAQDFPPGTRLTVTAQIELPTAQGETP